MSRAEAKRCNYVMGESDKIRDLYKFVVQENFICVCVLSVHLQITITCKLDMLANIYPGIVSCRWELN